MPPRSLLLRRVLSFGALLTIGPLLWIVLPPFVLLFALWEWLFGGERWRALAFGLVYVAFELAGLTAGLALSFSGPEPHRRVQRWWAEGLSRWAERIFGYRVQHEGELPPGPFVLLVRHASLADTPLPLRVIGHLHPRYVLKVELLWDPCLDLFGARLPNAFVRRGGGEAEVAKVAALARDVGPDEMVVIFPEGTRFATDRRQRRIERLEGERRERAERLRHTLLPLGQGTLELLGSGLPVVVMGHHGFERANDARALLDGSLVGATVRVRTWVYEAGEVEASEAWLFERWLELDAWLGELDGAY